MKRDLLITGSAMVVVWIVFKCFYPYADFFTDSYSYIQAAAGKDSIDYRPIGYSIFLRLVHGVSASDTFLVTLQYVLVQTASLVLYVRLEKLCQPARWVQRLILIFLVLNPVIPYTCNYVSSDALFIALSLLWLNLLIGIILRPSWGRLWLQLLLLALIFNIRYVALYYPAVAAIAFFLMRKDLLFKVVGITTSIVVVLAGIFFIKSITRQQTGAPIFSAFSGWQIANNALHIYPYIPVDTQGLPSAESKILAGYVKVYFDGAGPELIKKGRSATTAYMWMRGSPLHQYMFAWQKQHSVSYFIAWNRVAVVLTEYGYHLVRKHPLAFGRYYLWESAKSYFYTPLDVYAVYNEGNKDADVVAKDWFHYKSARLRVSSATIQRRLLGWIPALYIILNVVGVVAALLFLRVRELRQRHPEFTLCLRLICAYLLANAAFCIFASPTVLRYQVLPVILLFVFTVYAVHFVTSQYGDKSFTRQRRN
jgi:hypothetical protein